jgi:hypothetical protein
MMLCQPGFHIDGDSTLRNQTLPQSNLLDQKKNFRLHDSRIINTLARLSFLAFLNPSVVSKVNTLGAVISEVETGVIAVRVSDDDLSGQVDDFMQLDANRFQHGGRGQESLVPQELGAGSTLFGKGRRHERFKSWVVLLGDRVPKFGRSKMDVIDRV